VVVCDHENLGNKEAIAAAWAAEPEKIINNQAAEEVNSTFSPSMPMAVITCLGQYNLQNLKNHHYVLNVFLLISIIQNLWSAEHKSLNLKYFFRQFCRPSDSVARGGRVTRSTLSTPLLHTAR
jgi:hypothetical protein